MKLVSTALVITVSLLLSMQGVLPATYIIIGLLGLVCMITVYTSIITTGMLRHMLHNADEYLETINKNPIREDHMLRMLLHVMYFVSAYHIFLLGYTTMAIITGVCVFIIFLSNIVDAIYNREVDE